MRLLLVVGACSVASLAAGFAVVYRAGKDRRRRDRRGGYIL